MQVALRLLRPIPGEVLEILIFKLEFRILILWHISEQVLSYGPYLYTGHENLRKKKWSTARKCPVQHGISPHPLTTTIPLFSVSCVETRLDPLQNDDLQHGKSLLREYPVLHVYQSLICVSLLPKQ